MGYLLSAINLYQEWKRRTCKMDGNRCFGKRKKALENKCTAFNKVIKELSNMFLA